MKRLLLLNLAILLAITVFGQKERNAIDDKDKWNLSHLYPNEKAWEEDRDKVVAEMPKIEQFKGKLTKSSADLLACLDFSSKLDKEASRLFIYTIMKSDNTKTKLTASAFSKLRTSPNRADRQIAFEAFWKNFDNYKATYGQMLYGNVKGHIYRAQSRKYGSAIEASLSPKDIPVAVYQSLVDNVNKNLPAFHRYLAIKKRMLGVDTLKYLDLYAPVVKNVDLKYTYEEAQKLVLEALAPLGSEYVKTVNKAINERWIDVYPNKGKRSGAYSNGGAFDVHPYILMNFDESYSGVSTMAHELGHTMHSYFSNKTQPYPRSHYTTFVAEVASTFNEVLLFNYMIKNVKDDDIKLSLLMNWLDGFKGTLFRQ